MRTYPRNSPQAAARLVGLTILANGHVGRDELAALDEARIAERLGLRPGEFRTVLAGLCEDLQLTSHLSWDTLCRPGSEVMQQLFAELSDPRLRAEVLCLSRTAAKADRHISEGEFAILSAFADAWRLPYSLDLDSVRRGGRTANA
jgi:hypothetical protein